MSPDRLAAIRECYRATLVPLDECLTAACFPLMKIYTALHCLHQARVRGQVGRDTLVVESSSGTLALGLAIVCNILHQPLCTVTDYACDDTLRARLEDLGTIVDRVAAPAKDGGYQRARLDRLHEIRRERPDHWWLNQYDNPDNPGAFDTFAAQLAASLPRVDCLVGSVGSGGSLCGTARCLRRTWPDLTVVAVDTFNSVLFGHPDGPRTLRGLGNSLLPKNLEHTLIDRVHWVTAGEAYTATRHLHRATALFRGGTSGAVWLAARHEARQRPGAQVVCIFPDEGHRYTADVYNDRYLAEHRLWLTSLPDEPRPFSSAGGSDPCWSVMPWGRRTYAEVMAAGVLTTPGSGLL